MAGRVKLGTWGGSWGALGDIDGHPTRLAKIVIRSGQTIDSLAFDYIQDGETLTAGPWGGSGGDSTTIEFEPGEYLTAINGTTGIFYEATVVRSLTFVTNVRTYGPFGWEQPTAFSVPIEHGRIVAFYARFGGYLNAIGIYLMPN